VTRIEDESFRMRREMNGEHTCKKELRGIPTGKKKRERRLQNRELGITVM